MPVPWESADGRGPSYGFGPGPRSWLPQPESFAELALDRQRGVEGSTYELYRAAVRLRREHELGRGSLTWLEGYPEGVVAARIGDVTVLASTGPHGVTLPDGARVLLSSGPLADDGTLPADTTVWLVG